MLISPIMPPQDEKTAQERIKQILEAARDMKVYLDPHGFTLSWMADNSRTFVGVDDSGKVVAFAHMVFGRRYHEATFSATVMILATDAPATRQAVLAYLRDTAKMLGASVLMFEGVDGDTFPSDPMPLRAHKIE